MRRHLLGLASLLLLAVGVYFWLFVPPGEHENQFLHGGCVKAGSLLAAVWLAYPQLERMPEWIFAAILVVSLIIAVRPRAAILLVQIFLFSLPLWPLFWVFKPAKGKSSKTKAGKNQKGKPVASTSLTSGEKTPAKNR